MCEVTADHDLAIGLNDHGTHSAARDVWIETIEGRLRVESRSPEKDEPAKERHKAAESSSVA